MTERVEEIIQRASHITSEDTTLTLCSGCLRDAITAALAQAERERVRILDELRSIRPQCGHEWKFTDARGDEFEECVWCERDAARAEVERLKTAPQGTQSWRSCGHIAWGTCSMCYVERGQKLSEAEAALARVRAALQRADSMLSLIRHRASRSIPWGTVGMVTEGEVDEVIGQARAALEGR